MSWFPGSGDDVVVAAAVVVVAVAADDMDEGENGGNGPS